MEPSSLDCQESPWYDILEMTKLQRWRMDWGLPRRGGRREVGMAAKEEWEGSFWWTVLYLDCGGCTGYTCGEITHTHTHTHTHTQRKAHDAGACWIKSTHGTNVSCPPRAVRCGPARCHLGEKRGMVTGSLHHFLQLQRESTTPWK